LNKKVYGMKEQFIQIVDIMRYWLPLLLQFGAIILTFVCAVFYSKLNNLSVSTMIITGVFAVVGAAAGGTFWSEPGLLYTANSVIDIFSGPLGVIGVLLGGWLTASIYLMLSREPMLQYMDAALPAVVLGYMLARLGCFAAGDDFGVVTDVPWAVTFPPGSAAYQAHIMRDWIEPGSHASLAVHPAQLYHFFHAGFIFLVLNKIWFNSAVTRITFAMISYAGGRFLIQFLRDDHWQQDNVLDQAQWFCLLFIVTGITLWLYQRSRGYRLVEAATV